MSSELCSVVINTSPQVPKHTVGMFAELILAMEEAAMCARAYLKTGDINYARSFMDARMRLKALATRQELPQAEAKIMAGIHPLDEIGRAHSEELMGGG